MATFNQQGQVVHYQYNADTINFGGISSPQDLSTELEKLRIELEKAVKAGAVKGEAAEDAEYSIKKAVRQAEQPSPDKATLIDHLKTAKDLVSNVDGLVGTFAAAITAVGTIL